VRVCARAHMCVCMSNFMFVLAFVYQVSSAFQGRMVCVYACAHACVCVCVCMCIFMFLHIYVYRVLSAFQERMVCVCVRAHACE